MNLEEHNTSVRDTSRRIVEKQWDATVTGEIVGDPINPSHYKRFGTEVYDMISVILNSVTFSNPQSYADLSNVAKYLLRLGAKGSPMEDLEKIRWYLNNLIEREDPSENTK